MKMPLFMIAALGLLMAACNRQAAAPAAPKTDLDRFQGTWYLVMAMQDGKILPEDKVKQTTIVFKGDTFRLPRVGGVRHEQVGDDQARRNENAKGDGRHLHRERSHARHLRAGRGRLQGVLRSGRQATSHPIWVPTLGVATSSRSGHGRRKTKQKRPLFSGCLCKSSAVRPLSFSTRASRRFSPALQPKLHLHFPPGRI